MKIKLAIDTFKKYCDKNKISPTELAYQGSKIVKFLGSGAARSGFLCKGYVFKVDYDGYDNKFELSNYKKVNKIHPDTKYLLAPYVTAFKYKNAFITVFKKIDNVGRYDDPIWSFRKNKLKKNMLNVIQYMTEDDHGGNIGTFGKGCVLIDFNYQNINKQKIKENIKVLKNIPEWNKYKRFWKSNKK
jgi:hypothetical protein